MLTRRLVLLSMSATGLATSFVISRWVIVARAAEMFAVSHSDAEWQKLLTPAQYAVLRQEATERPFTSKLLEEHRTGIYVCAGCDLSLFSSAAKFESGTGWPSFWEPLPRSVGTRMEGAVGTVQTEVHCGRCGGHLGHVYDDGPKPTGLRYCMNGLALNFKAAIA